MNRRLLAAMSLILVVAAVAVVLLRSPRVEDSTPREPQTAWHVQVVASGLDHPWGLAVLPDGDALFTHRSGGISLLHDGRVRQVAAAPADLYATGEAGHLGLELSPTFASGGRFFTCLATTAGDVEVRAWRLSADRASASPAGSLIRGLTLNPSGRHSGCRLRLGADRMLYVSAGDSAHGTNPQDLHALGGKVLRVDPATGQPPPGNPFLSASDPRTRLIWSYGHRNPQGLALRTDGTLFDAEHGPDVNDEVNLLRPGSNYGWNPVGSGEYDESRPMTDPRIPHAVPAVWSSGDHTLAISGATFLHGAAWGPHQGQLALCALKASAVYLLDVDTGAFGKVAALDHTHGRLRSCESAPDGSLWVTTDNGGGNDQILRVTPTR